MTYQRNVHIVFNVYSAIEIFAENLMQVDVRVVLKFSGYPEIPRVLIYTTGRAYADSLERQPEEFFVFQHRL